ncbi:MAG: GNAT family N-acetyltransferase [Clostridiaceae bacterium]
MEIKDFRVEYLNDILKLFKETFNKEMSKDYWLWRYNNSLIKEKYIKLMFDKDILASHYAVFPVFLKVDKDILKTGFSMTTMTSKKYQGRGIFKILANELYSDSFNKLDLIWGFPNNNSLYGFKKNLNWQHICDIKTLSINLENATFNINDKNISIVSSFNNDYTMFIKENLKDKVYVNRDVNYLTWRYLKNPINKYYIVEYRENHKLTAYCIYKFYNLNGYICGDIVDIVSKNEFYFSEIIKYTLSKIKHSMGCNANIWINNANFEKVLFDLGFYETDQLTHFGVRLNCNKNINLNIYDFKNWYLTMGDSDIF